MSLPLQAGQASRMDHHRRRVRALLAPLAAALLLSGLSLGGCATGEKGGKGAPDELPPDPVLLARAPMVIDAVVYDDPALSAQAERIRAALGRLAGGEGFTVVRSRPKGPSVLLQASVQWSPATGLADQHLFLSLVVDQDGERVDEVSLQQTEGLPAAQADLDKLLAPLLRKLARSPRLRDRIKAM